MSELLQLLLVPPRSGWSLRASQTMLVLTVAAAAQGQLRIVTYNTTKDGPHPGLATVLQAIGEESTNGIARPVDVLLLQEQDSPYGDTQEIVDMLNGLYGAGMYAHGNAVGGTSDPDDRQTIVYKTSSVALVSELAFGNVGEGANQQPRQTMRYLLRPIGYDDARASIYVYNSHAKADDGSAEEARRLVEAKAIRTNYTTLPEGSHAIYAGDFNFYRSTDDAFQWLTMGGSGQAIDPINRVGNWNNSSSFADVHTQSPCNAPVGVCRGTIGGMDDRFDFQLLTAPVFDGEGLSYIFGSYRAFGNNGSTFNQNINQRNANNQLVNTYSFSGVVNFTKAQILDSLWTAADHLPVVADYQLPAVMQVVAGTVPPTLAVGQAFDLAVLVNNAANVVASNGADELDYSLTTSGALSGTYLDQMDLALGGGNTHLVALDTATPGMKSGMITISSMSQAVQNGLINIPVSFEVVPLTLPGDYNQNGEVDAADYVVWRDTFGQSVSHNSGADGNGDGTINDGDYAVWRTGFGNTASSIVATAGGASSEVPEPSTMLTLLLGVCLARLAGGTLGICTRRS
jgi:endonuclease/exonuclease/phosphatase family metal-dependent hydrolase